MIDTKNDLLQNLSILGRELDGEWRPVDPCVSTTDNRFAVLFDTLSDLIYALQLQENKKEDAT